MEGRGARAEGAAEGRQSGAALLCSPQKAQWEALLWLPTELLQGTDTSEVRLGVKLKGETRILPSSGSLFYSFVGKKLERNTATFIKLQQVNGF